MEEPNFKNLTSDKFGKPKKYQNKLLQAVGKPHVDSFDFLIDKGLKEVVEKLAPVEFEKNDVRITIKITDAQLFPPKVPSSVVARTRELWPTECRQRLCSYNGPLFIKFEWTVGDSKYAFERELGALPIMVKSKLCHLSTLSPEQLVKHGEHEDEWGGYFIVNGKEKLIRMLQYTRRNYPVAVQRSTWKQKGTNFSDLGVLIRCIQKDHTAANNVLHYVNDATVQLMIIYRKRLYYIPLILIIKCLVNLTDIAIYHRLIEGYEDDQCLKRAIKHMMRHLHEQNVHDHIDARVFVGKTFRVRVNEAESSWSDESICDHIIKNCILIHLDSYQDKFNLIIMMTQKLFSLANGQCVVESLDGVMMHELLLGGHLYLQVFKEKIGRWLNNIKLAIVKKTTKSITLLPDEMALILKRCGTLEAGFENFLATGNISSKTGLGLMQEKGLVIIAENINRQRYMSHFRSVHRGAFFQEMRTTEARRFLPDSWGFICPVHTPDGTPCGLLNHLARHCQISVEPDEKIVSKLPILLTTLGMQLIESYRPSPVRVCYTVILDGCVIGYVPDELVKNFVNTLRILKTLEEKVPNTLEIVLVPKKSYKSQYPGVFLFSGSARMMRPVQNLAAKKVELIGTFEQIYMDICLKPNEFIENVTTHMELGSGNILSNVASLIPLPEFNPSPRNMYQCQMGKQSMGTPIHNWRANSESKLYRLETPSSPLFRTEYNEKLGLDEFPMGMNAVVAVMSYTGYDMEDALVINKMSMERGFGYGSIVKTETVDLKSASSYFGLDPSRPELSEYLDEDGLPSPGMRISQGKPYYCYFNYQTSKYAVGNWTSVEEAVVENIKLCGSFPKESVATKACITFRIPRKPSIGDKFASRAGQKGICSMLWPTEDMPFTENGLAPDIIFNPHGFPSRMTIAMLIECMAGKSAAIHGVAHDATPFKFSEEDPAFTYFGKLLQAGGYNYYGNERLYCGITGREINCDIFTGVVHYQRLRHMVSDKWQVRSTGPIDSITRQPIKGRRRGGGIRFGEMERDALIAHGAAFLLKDRLMNCSDKYTALICRPCGSILSPLFIPEGDMTPEVLTCKLCDSGGCIERIDIPYIFKYLITQLAAVNIKLTIKCEDDY